MCAVVAIVVVVGLRCLWRRRGEAVTTMQVPVVQVPAVVLMLLLLLVVVVVVVGAPRMWRRVANLGRHTAGRRCHVARGLRVVLRRALRAAAQVLAAVAVEVVAMARRAWQPSGRFAWSTQAWVAWGKRRGVVMMVVPVLVTTPLVLVVLVVLVVVLGLALVWCVEDDSHQRHPSHTLPPGRPQRRLEPTTLERHVPRKR